MRTTKFALSSPKLVLIVLSERYNYTRLYKKVKLTNVYYLTILLKNNYLKIVTGVIIEETSKVV